MTIDKKDTSKAKTPKLVKQIYSLLVPSNSQIQFPKQLIKLPSPNINQSLKN